MKKPQAPEDVIHSRQYSLLIPEDITGGPDRNNGALLADLALRHRTALERAESAVTRLEQSTGKVAVNKIYFDAIQVKGFRPYLLVKITFNLHTPKKRLYVIAGSDIKGTIGSGFQ